SEVYYSYLIRNPCSSMFRLRQNGEHTLQEYLRALMPGILKYFLRIALFYDHTIGDKDDTIRNITRELHFMRHYYHRTSFIGQVPHDFENLAHQFRIERGGWFIKE